MKAFIAILIIVVILVGIGFIANKAAKTIEEYEDGEPY